MNRLQIQAFGVRVRDEHMYRGSIVGEGEELSVPSPHAHDVNSGLKGLAELLGSGAVLHHQPAPPLADVSIAFSYTLPYDAISEGGRMGDTYPLNEKQRTIFQEVFLSTYNRTQKHPEPMPGAHHV